MKAELFELLPDVVLFVAVARAGNFSRAARVIGMPVSTLSRRIAEFEGKLGVQLLHRSTRQLELTAAGARYFERCQVVVEVAEAAQSALHGETAHPRGKLRVSTTADFALTYLQPLLAEFASRYPDISFDLDLSARPVDLIGEGFDVAIRMGALPDSQLFVRKLASAPMGLYAAPAYLEGASPLRAPADLASHACLRILGPADGTTRWTLARGEEVEAVDVKGRFIANGMRFLVELAAAGLGIALVDAGVARSAVKAGQLVQVLPAWSPAPVAVHALTPSKFLAARTKLFLDCLTDHLRVDALAGPATPRARATRRA